MTNGACPICQTELAAGTAVCMACGYNALEGAPLPGWVRQGVDLRTVARRQRLLMWFIAGLFGLQVLMPIAASSTLLMVALAPLMWLGTTIGIGFMVFTLLAALRRNAIVNVLCTILLLAPCVNLFVLAQLSQIGKRWRDFVALAWAPRPISGPKRL